MPVSRRQAPWLLWFLTGTYPYLPNGREVEAHPQAVTALEEVLHERRIDYRLGKSWTTDAIYRETDARRAQRMAEGCQVVEMEAAPFFAVAKFRGVACGQIIYGGDLVVPEGWDGRGWYQRGDDRTLLFWLAVQVCIRLKKHLLTPTGLEVGRQAVEAQTDAAQGALPLGQRGGEQIIANVCDAGCRSSTVLDRSQAPQGVHIHIRVHFFAQPQSGIDYGRVLSDQRIAVRNHVMDIASTENLCGWRKTFDLLTSALEVLVGVKLEKQRPPIGDAQRFLNKSSPVMEFTGLAAG